MKGNLIKQIAIFLALLLGSGLLMQFVWQVSEPAPSPAAYSAEKVNLALRRTAHLLLKESGDSTTRIPPVSQTGDHTWLVPLNRSFSYDALPAILHTSFELHQIATPYNVGILRCDDGQLLLGYHFADHIQNNDVTCGGRELPPDCYQLQVTFLTETPASRPMPVTGWLISAVLAVTLFGIGKKWSHRPAQTENSDQERASEGIAFGHSRLDVNNLALYCGAVRHHLTYREAKLLHLFVQHPNQVLERSLILNNVWADEGVLVGRSVDMFVSRLRKMLRDDPSIQLVAVHGVGYRLEVG